MLSDKVEEVHEEDVEAETAAQIRKEAQESLEQNFTPSLARRLSRQFIEQTRQSVPRSPSSTRDNNRYYQSPTRDLAQSLIGPSEMTKRYSTSTMSDRTTTEHRGRSLDRGIRRTNSLLEPCKYDRSERHSPRRSISLFDDDDCDDKLLPPLPKHIMTLGRKYKESIRSNVVGNVRRDSFHGYRTDKIQEEPGDDTYLSACKEDIDNVAENGSTSEGTSISVCNSNANSMDNTTTTTIATTTTSSMSVRSCEISPTESLSNLGDYGKSICKPDISKSFENRLLAAENLIKESKLKNLTSQQFNPNLSCNYKDTDKCDKETLATTSDPLSSASSVVSKRRSCIPSLRLRSGSLTRESSVSADHSKSLAVDSSDASTGGVNQERSILSKLFRGSGSGSGSGNGNGIGKEAEPKEPKDSNRSQKSKQHRISRFLRPDFFDTPREESQYVKEKEAQRAAENERRKSRFMKRKSEGKERKEDGSRGEMICKEQKNEINALQKDKLGNVVSGTTASSSSSSSFENKSNGDRGRGKLDQGSRSSFLYSLEKKLERLRSNDETTSAATKPSAPMLNGSSISGDLGKERELRECSAPPVECPPAESSLLEVKRTLSVEDLTRRQGSNKSAKNVPSRGRVTSVLGLFKTNADTTKRTANGSSSRSQNAIMSKLKRSPPKCVKTSQAESSLEDDVTATSKIPTKFARTDNKPAKKLPENKRSPEKVVSECKRSPPKEKSKERRESIAKERKPFVDDRQSREFKRAPERAAPSSDSSASSSADKIKLDKVDSLRKSSDQSESLRKVVDLDKHAESIINSEDRKLIKTKRNINSLVSKNESVTKIDKGEDVDKKINKKPVKSKEDADKDEINGSRKKRIVRVVRKVVKKSSDNSESKSDEKGKSSKPLTKKKAMTMKKEKDPEDPTVTAQGLIQGNDSDDRTFAAKSSEQAESEPKDSEHAMENINMNEIKTDTKETRATSDKSDINVSSTDLPQANSILWNASSSSSVSSALPMDPSCSTGRSFNIYQSKQQSSEQHRSSRANLKLDLSKIPQHTFRHATPKRDSPRSGSPEANPATFRGSSETDNLTAESGDRHSNKLIEHLSKMTHHANITGNKIIIDKPLRAKDVAELKREVTEYARIIENHVESRDGPDCPSQRTVDQATRFVSDEPVQNESKKIKPDSSEGLNDDTVTKEPPEDCTSEMFSPEEPESFDSWSICSADLNHNRGDLHSPTSLSYSLFMRGDSSESVIDRIRRRSFYSRFNDRKRPSLTAPPPGVSSMTLPRRFSFNSSRERERDRLYNYGVPRTRYIHSLCSSFPDFSPS